MPFSSSPSFCRPSVHQSKAGSESSFVQVPGKIPKIVRWGEVTAAVQRHLQSWPHPCLPQNACGHALREQSIPDRMGLLTSAEAGLPYNDRPVGQRETV